MTRVLLIGATGDLGTLIGRALVARGARLRVLVRTQSRPRLAADLAAAAEVTSSAADAFADVAVVISAVQGGPGTIIDAQLDFLRRARMAGVRRFLPSDFSFNHFALADGDNVNADWRRAFAAAAVQERGDVEVVHLLNGAFIDHRVLFGFLGALDLDRREAYLWGDGGHKMEFTTYADTAAYTAAVALDPDEVPSPFCVAAESLDFHELVAEVSAGLGAPMRVVRRGTLADLDAEIADRMQRQPHEVLAWLALAYWRAMLNGKGHLGPLMNARYPHIEPTGVRAYLERHPRQPQPGPA